MSALAMMFENSTGAASKCADVVITPNFGTTPLVITVNTSTTGAHIFYTKKSGTDGVDPTHSGDSATGTTIRIGSNFGSINVGAGNWVVRALAYNPSFIDSDISEGDYDTGGGG